MLFYISLDGWDDPLSESLKRYYKGTAPYVGSGGWLEALPSAYSWEAFGKFPSEPKYRPPGGPGNAARERWLAEKSAKEECDRARTAYIQRLHADENYRKAATEVLEKQRREPGCFLAARGRKSELITCWRYRDKILRVEAPETEVPFESIPLLLKHHVLRGERNYEKIRREVEALENMEKLEGVSREPIPDSVRLFVWQRDKGQCVKCGSRERLEFDHIIPVVAGGSNTERNVQLLCESCNRSKGPTV